MKIIKFILILLSINVIYFFVAHLVHTYIRENVGEFNAFGLLNDLDEYRDAVSS